MCTLHTHTNDRRDQHIALDLARDLVISFVSQNILLNVLYVRHKFNWTHLAFLKINVHAKINTPKNAYAVLSSLFYISNFCYSDKLAEWIKMTELGFWQFLVGPLTLWVWCSRSSPGTQSASPALNGVRKNLLYKSNCHHLWVTGVVSQRRFQVDIFLFCIQNHPKLVTDRVDIVPKLFIPIGSW